MPYPTQTAIILQYMGFDPESFEVHAVPGGTEIRVWDNPATQPTIAEVEAVESVAVAAWNADRTERTDARTKIEQALSELDTIIDNIDGYTLAQSKGAVKKLAQIQRAIIRLRT